MNGSISCILGDITQSSEVAIVNAANANLLAGGGVCGAIHRAAGPQLEAACRLLAPCPTGSAVITPGFNLRARYVIHSVAPRWMGGDRGEPELLTACYRSVFDLVRKHSIQSLALPAIGTGIYHYPLEAATEIAVAEAKEHIKLTPETAISFVCFDERTLAAYSKLGC